MDMLCMLLVVEKEQERPESLERIGCLLNDVSLVRALEPHEPAVFPERERVSSIFNGLLERGRLQEQALPLPLWQFFQAGLLSRPEMIAFLAAACVDRNRKYERIFGILQEESGASARPTVGLVCDLCSLLCAPEEQAQAVLLDEDSFLNRFLLQTPKEDANQSKLSRPLSLHKRVLSVLLGEADQLGDLSVFTELMTAPEELSDVICQEEKLDELARACASAFSEPIEKTVFCLEGIKGVGKKFLMNQLSAIMMRDVLCVHMDKLLDAAQSEHTMQEYLKELILAGILEDKIIYIESILCRFDIPLTKSSILLVYSEICHKSQGITCSNRCRIEDIDETPVSGRYSHTSHTFIESGSFLGYITYSIYRIWRI